MKPHYKYIRFARASKWAWTEIKAAQPGATLPWPQRKPHLPVPEGCLLGLRSRCGVFLVRAMV